MSPIDILHVQTKREIEETLLSAGVRPRKRLGQNFLIDGNIMRQIAASAELTSADSVLEVGAGTGGLTDLLVPCCGWVTCVEIDKAFQIILQRRFDSFPHFELIKGDVLSGKHELSPDVIAALERSAANFGASTKLVANLPYHVAAPLLMNLLLDYPNVRSFVFTVQAEVGEKIIAKPGGRSYGPLGITAQAIAEVRILRRVPPEAFWPRPKVDSVLMSAHVHARPFHDAKHQRRFSALIRTAFDHRRKTLRSALACAFPLQDVETWMRGLDGSRRPESFSIDEWLHMSKSFKIRV